MSHPWSTALPDWERRLMAGESLVPSGLPLNEAEAARAVRVFDRLRVPDVVGQPRFAVAARDWFRDIVRVLFGALNEDASRRHIQELFLLVPKKNAKSTQAAGLMLTALIVNRRPNDEAMFLAPTKEVADICYGQAEKMIKADAELSKLFHVQRHIRQITHRGSDSFLKIKAADTDAVTGFKGSKALIDETHVFAAHPRAADVFLEVRGALAAKPDGFLAQITTQSKKPPAGIFRQELEQARAVRDGKLDLPMLAVLYELPLRLQEWPKDGSQPGWKDPANYGLVNPNLGLSVDPPFLERELRKAEQSGSEALSLFASQHFNVEIGVALSTDGWAGQDVWMNSIESGLTLDQIIERCEVLTMGIDGGGLDDLLGLAVIGRERETKRWLHWAHALIGPEALKRRKANEPRYRDFEGDGDMTIVKQLPDDVLFVADIAQRCLDSGKLAQVGVDPAGVGSIVDALEGIGISEESKMLVGVPQGIRLMNASKTIERKLSDRTFRHAGSRLMAWCVGNAKVRATPTAVLVERAASGFGKIDPLMATFNAAHLMGMNPEPQGSVYEERGILVI